MAFWMPAVEIAALASVSVQLDQRLDVVARDGATERPPRQRRQNRPCTRLVLRSAADEDLRAARRVAATGRVERPADRQLGRFRARRRGRRTA